MIYLKNTPGPQAVLIPRTVRIFAADGWALELRSRTTGERAVFDGLADVGGKTLYVGLRVDLEGKQIANGEYFYTLDNGGGIVAQGLAAVGDVKPEIIAFEEGRRLIQFNG